MNDWPHTRAWLTEHDYSFEFRTSCRGNRCRKTIEFWRSPGGRLLPLEQVFANDPNLLTPHWTLCPNEKEFRQPAKPASPTGREVREEQKARSDDKRVILRLLQEAGPGGVTNQKLNEVCLRYAARIWELREKFDIETRKEKRGVFRFVFHGEKKKQAELFA